MAVHAVKLEIVKPVDMDWNDLGPILKDIQYDTREILNKTLQKCWEWSGFSADYKREFDTYPKDSEIYGYSNMQGYCYNIFKDVYTKMNTGNLNITIRKGVDRWKNDFKDILKGEKSIPNYKAFQPIELRNSNIKILKEGEEYYALLSLLSTSLSRELGRADGRVKVLLKTNVKHKSFIVPILERCIGGEYGISGSQIILENKAGKKPKCFLSLKYNFSDDNGSSGDGISYDKVLGVMLGFNEPIYMAVNSTDRSECINGDEVISFYKQMKKRKTRLYEKMKYCGEGKVGHGLSKRYEPFAFARDIVANFKNTYNHKCARAIVQYAAKNKCGLIQMMNLENGDLNMLFLKEWPHFDLQEKISYKAKDAGISVINLELDKEKLYNRCSCCGYVNSDEGDENKKASGDASRAIGDGQWLRNKSVHLDKGSMFSCEACGFEAKFDLNAARNLADPNIASICEIAAKRRAKRQVV